MYIDSGLELIAAPRRILKLALELLKRQGWIQGEYGTAEEGYCSLGAIRAATETYGFSTNDRLDAEMLLKDAIDGEIPDWNDDPERTFAEVCMAITTAAGE